MTADDSLLTQELVLEIRKRVLNNENYINIQAELDINANTWDTWVNKNYKDFRTNLQNWKAERIIRKAEKVGEVILDMSHEDVDKEGRKIILGDVLRVKQKEAEFNRETLGKEIGYTKRAEQTGKDGAPLAISIDTAIADKHNLHATDTSPEDNSIGQH